MGPRGHHRGAPVCEVQNGLDGVATARGDVTLEARKQRQKHIDAETLPQPGEKGRGSCV